jgi:hypothetical protein
LAKIICGLAAVYGTIEIIKTFFRFGLIIMPMFKNWEKNSLAPDNQGLPKPQKNAVLALAALAVFIVVFWAWQMQSHIKAPFDYGKTTETDGTAEEEYNKLLKNADTDKDGLSDYDEIYTYKTSPYLEDTDSDGLSDKKEIDNGTNPVCPEGKDCAAAIDTSAVATTSAAVVSDNSTTSTNTTVTLNSSTINETILQNVLDGKSDAATLRQFLLSGGASQEELNLISDEDLLKSYQETLKNQNANTTNE